jgi:hypothetical protein
MRRAGKGFFVHQLRHGVQDRQLPKNTDIESLVAALKATLAGKPGLRRPSSNSSELDQSMSECRLLGPAVAPHA